MAKRILIIVLLLLPWQAWSRDAPIVFQDRPVVEVLLDFQQLGYGVLYSTGVVRPSLQFISEPPAGPAIDRLAQALSAIGLALHHDEGQNYRITRGAEPQSNTLKGRVLDANTGAVLVGVQVEIDGQIYTTDEKGQFQLVVNKLPQAITVSHNGYLPQTVATPALIDEIRLLPKLSMEELVVVSSRYAINRAHEADNVQDLTLFNSVPRLGEDPLRITNHLPGMASLGLSAKPHIRGGLQDEVLILFNNLELLEPFHLKDFQSIFSSFNPSVIGATDVYTGGYPARYGDRMSGVMDIDTAQEIGPRHGELSLSLFNTTALFNGSLNDNRGYWFLSARRGNLDIVTKEINPSLGRPSYSDALGQLRYELDAQTELDIGFILYNDDIKLKEFDVDGEIAESRYENVYFWTQLHRSWSPRWDGSTLLYYGSINHRRDGFLFDEDLDNGEATVDDARDFSLWSLAQHLRYTHSQSLYAEFGVELSYQRGKYDYARQYPARRAVSVCWRTLVRVACCTIFTKRYLHGRIRFCQMATTQAIVTRGGATLGLPGLRSRRPSNQPAF